MGKEIELSTAITDIAAGPFGSNLKVECFVPSGFPIIDGANLKGYKVTDNITKFVTEEKARSLSRSIGTSRRCDCYNQWYDWANSIYSGRFIV